MQPGLDIYTKLRKNQTLFLSPDYGFLVKIQKSAMFMSTHATHGQMYFTQRRNDQSAILEYKTEWLLYCFPETGRSDSRIRSQKAILVRVTMKLPSQCHCMDFTLFLQFSNAISNCSHVSFKLARCLLKTFCPSRVPSTSYNEN